MPARLWAPSQISSGASPRRSSRPGSSTSCAACGSTSAPRYASAAATASARLLAPDVTTSAAPFARASSSHSPCPRTTVDPGCTTASFSAAICSRVSPSTSMWSSATLVSTTTRVRSTFVASWRPPSPASTTATSTSACANSVSAAAVRISNCAASPASGRMRATARSKSASSPFTRMRSLQVRTCGERYVPTRRPASRRSASIIRVVVDLPFVPTTWIARYRVSGLPSRPSSAWMRSSPKPSFGQGLSAPTQLVADCVELTPVALELLALGLDDVRGRPGGERLVCEHALGALDLAFEPRDLRIRVPAVLLCALRLHDRVEDPLLVAFERGEHAAAAEALGRLLHADERIDVVAVGPLRLEPLRDDQSRLAVRQVRPDLFRHMRHHRMQQLQQPLECGKRRRLRFGVVLEEPRLDRLEIPVAEVVEGKVVQASDGVREVIGVEVALDLRARRIDPRQDPPLLE